MIDLPELQKWELVASQGRFCIKPKTKNLYSFTEAQADEIIRRCKAEPKLREAIEAALRISDLWTLKEVETMFEDEAKALEIMKTSFEQALEEQK